MPSDGDTGDDVLDRLWRLAAQAIEPADRVLDDGEGTVGAAEEPHPRATSARERAALANAASWRRTFGRSSCTSRRPNCSSVSMGAGLTARSG